MKTIDELEFTDDYMFGEVLKNKELCIGVLERLLRIKVADIEYPELQKSLKAGYEAHGIRLDVYVANSKSVYDIELQNKVFENLGKRTRFYQSMIDADFLLKGKDYSELKESFILFVCKTDPFNKGFPCYTFESLCKEDTSLSLNDKAIKVIYNASRYKEEKDKALRAFLHFVCTNEATDDFTEKLVTRVTQIKKDENFRTEYSKMNVAFADARREAKAEGITEGIAKGIALGTKKGLISGRNEKALEAAIILVQDFNIAPEIAANKMNVTLDELLLKLNN